MVRESIGHPTDLTGGAFVHFVQHTIAVYIWVAGIAIGITVKIDLVAVGDLWTVVNAVKHAVKVEVCFVQPNPHVVLISLVKGMSTIEAVAIGNEGDDRGAQGTHPHHAWNVVPLATC